MQDKKQIAEIKEKLQRILSYEALHPDRLEQKITTVKNFLCNELLQERHILPIPQNNCVNDKADELILENQIIREENEKRKNTIHMANAILNENPELKRQFIEAKKKYLQKQENLVKEKPISPENNPNKPKHRR